MGGLPWWSSGEDSARLLQGTKVQSLVEEIRSCMLYGVAKKKNLDIPPPQLSTLGGAWRPQILLANTITWADQLDYNTH